jgi:2-polyprenyl-6-methoxyphenol hydroxylase-like FAD-dependent oxidoreductase
MIVHDVIIVGAGPAGLFTACELARQGVKARLLERSTAHHGQARGTALQPGTLEVLSRAGVLERFLGAGVHVHAVHMCRPGLITIGRTRLAGIDAAYEFECSQPQSQTEEILWEHLQSLGGTVELGVSITEVEDAEDHLRVTMTHQDGSTETARARFVVGAGGSHSVVRSSMPESRLEGHTYEGDYIVADVKIGIEPTPGEATVVVGPAGLALIAPLPDQRFLIFVDCPELPVGGPSVDLLGRLLDERAGLEVGAHDVRWISSFKMHKRLAPKMADGRRFLVGDAGHASSPLGGHGLNTALMDAADVAWKLALVVRGQGRQALLESYALERGQADDHVLQVSDGVHTAVLALVQAAREGKEEAPAPPDEAAELAQRRSKSLLDISYQGSPLVGEWLAPEVPRPQGPAPGERYPDRIALQGPNHHLLLFGKPPEGLKRFQARWRELVETLDPSKVGLQPERAGVPDGGLVLIRPDGYIGFRATPSNAEALRALDAHLDSYLIPGDDDQLRTLGGPER